MHLVVTADEFLLLVYESVCILNTLAFGDHFYGSFGKPKNGAIGMSFFTCILNIALLFILRL